MFLERLQFPTLPPILSESALNILKSIALLILFSYFLETITGSETQILSKSIKVFRNIWHSHSSQLSAYFLSFKSELHIYRELPSDKIKPQIIYLTTSYHYFYTLK